MLYIVSVLFHIPDLCFFLTACRPGFFGNHCNERCNSHCLAIKHCRNTDGTCIDGCKNGYIGERCDKCKKFTYLYFMNRYKFVRSDLHFKAIYCVAYVYIIFLLQHVSMDILVQTVLVFALRNALMDVDTLTGFVSVCLVTWGFIVAKVFIHTYV